MAFVPTHVVDASAVIVLLKAEDGHDVFADLLKDGRNVFGIHTVNLCEVYYNYLRVDGVEQAEEAWTSAATLMGVIEKFDAQFVKRVARWKVDYQLPLGDAFAAAAAEEHGCELVTTDRSDFGPVAAAAALKICWLR